MWCSTESEKVPLNLIVSRVKFVTQTFQVVLFIDNNVGKHCTTLSVYWGRNQVLPEKALIQQISSVNFANDYLLVKKMTLTKNLKLKTRGPFLQYKFNRLKNSQ